MPNIQQSRGPSKAVEALRIDINAGTDGASYPKVIDFRTLADHYITHELPLDQSEATVQKAYSTIVTNKRYLKLWIVPRWARVKIDPKHWHPVEIEAWLRELGKEHSLANGTRAKIRNIMSAVFRHAIRHGFLPRDEYANPMKYVRQSAASDFQPAVLTEAQVVAILARLQEPFRTLALLGATTGLRISELLGLKWLDVDFQRLEIRVQRAIVYGVVGGCKSKASKRPIPLDSRIAELLFDWPCKTEYNQSADFVFASWKTKGAKPYATRSLLEKNLQPAARAAGITQPVGWHTFRRTVATLLVYYGEDVKVVQELLRHANIKTTLDLYAQAVTPAKRGAHSKLVGALVPQGKVI